MKKIIAAIDLSDASEELCFFALDFASKIGAEVIFLSILDDWDVSAIGKISSMGYNVDGDHYSEDIEHESIENFKKIINKFDIDNVEKKLVLKTGQPAKEILRLIVNEKADAVILGVKKHKDLEHSLELSVSDKIFRKAPVTVISFRPEHYAKKLRKKIH